MSSFEHFESENDTHSDSDSDGDGGSNNNDQAKRQGRGPNKPKWGKSGKEKIEFTKDGLCIVPKDAKLSRYLGSLARNYNIFPLSPRDWRKYSDSEREKMWKIISDTIEWREEDIPNIPKIRYVLLKRLSKRVRNHRAKLKELYYTPYVGSPLRFICGNDRVDSEQWRAMVSYWDNDPKNKNRVEKNIESRKKLTMSHTGGTKSFIRHLAEFEQKNGHPADPIEGFDMLHKRNKKQKTWVDDASEQIGANISQELTKLVATHGEETPELRLQAYVAVRGFETGGRVRGYGDVVTPNMVQWVHQTQPISSIRRSRRGQDYAALESNYLDLQAKYEKQQKDMEELRHMILSSQNQSSNLQLENSASENRSSSQELSLHSQSHQSPPQHQLSTQQQSPSRHQSHSHQRSPSQQMPSSHQPHYSQPSTYRYPLSSQVYYPQSFQPPLYPQMHYGHGEFTSMLNDSDFLQRFMPSHPRNSQND